MVYHFLLLLLTTTLEKCRIYLKFKDLVLGVFNQFYASIEREKEESWKCVIMDNGGEYRGQFEEYCKGNEIKIKKIVPKTP